MTRKLSLLDLPSDIRRLIFSHAGLSRPCPVTISPKLTSGPVRVDFGDCCVYIMKCLEDVNPIYPKQEFDCYCPFFPLALLRVCRSMHQEAMAFFYGTNKFQVLGNAENDLKILFTLPRLALASMTFLLVRLNCWPCLRGHDEVNFRHKVCRICGTSLPEIDSTSNLRSEANQRYFSAWATVCVHLANFIQPNQLDFTFIGDVQDVHTAQDICSSIKLLPSLKICNIRLGRSPDYELSEIARQTAQQQTLDKSTTVQSFQFFQLPQELRLHILGYTHLAPGGGFDSRYKDITIIKNHIHVRDRSFAVPWRCCWHCNNTRSNCCCPAGRAAVSKSCLCRKIPHELFRVSKRMKVEAEHIFFSSNCFNFNMDIEDNSLFIVSRWSKENRKSIRQIRIMFNSNQIIGWKETLPAWHKFLDLVHRDFNVKNLCLIIHTEQNYYMCLWTKDDNRLRHVYDAYCQIALEVHRLHGLRELHLDFHWFGGLEVLLEKHIMGNDYNSDIEKKRPKQATFGPISELPHWHASAWEKIVSDHDKIPDD